MDTEKRDDDFWMGSEAPLNWIMIYVTMIAIIVIVMGGTAIVREFYDRYECRRLVGDNHLFLKGDCYQVIDNVPYWVDLDMARALEKLK